MDIFSITLCFRQALHRHWNSMFMKTMLEAMVRIRTLTTLLSILRDPSSMRLKSAWQFGDPHVLLFASRPYLAAHLIPVSPWKQSWVTSPAKFGIWSAVIPCGPKTGPPSAYRIVTLGTPGRNVVPVSMASNKAVCLLPHNHNWLQISFAGRCNWSRCSSSSMLHVHVHRAYRWQTLVIL